MIGPYERALLALLLLLLMTGMGATLTLDSFRALTKNPRGVLIGLASQFGWMPLVGFGLVSAFALDPNLGLGLLIVGCTPGGTTSNLFTYYSRADVALSIAMTVVSTAAAVVAMPLLLSAYASGFDGLDFEIPIGNIAITLVLVLVPVAIGMAIRSKNLALAKKIEKAGSVSGMIVIVLLVGSAVWNNHQLFLTIPAGGYAASILLGVIGMLLGYLFATLLKLSVAQRRAVALETGIQNTPLSFAVILATLPGAAADEALQLPMLYALFILITASLATLAFRARDATSTPA